MVTWKQLSVAKTNPGLGDSRTRYPPVINAFPGADTVVADAVDDMGVIKIHSMGDYFVIDSLSLFPFSCFPIVRFLSDVRFTSLTVNGMMYCNLLNCISLHMDEKYINPISVSSIEVTLQHCFSH